MSAATWAHRPLVNPDYVPDGGGLRSWAYGPVCHCERPWRHPNGCAYVGPAPRAIPPGLLQGQAPDSFMRGRP